MVEEDRRIEQALRTAAAIYDEIVDVHQITVGRTAEHISLSCHCTLPDDLPMHRVHEIITALEDRLQLEVPRSASRHNPSRAGDRQHCVEGLRAPQARNRPSASAV